MEQVKKPQEVSKKVLTTKTTKEQKEQVNEKKTEKPKKVVTETDSGSDSNSENETKQKKEKRVPVNLSLDSYDDQISTLTKTIADLQEHLRVLKDMRKGVVRHCKNEEAEKKKKEDAKNKKEELSNEIVHVDDKFADVLGIKKDMNDDKLKRKDLTNAFTDYLKAHSLVVRETNANGNGPNQYFKLNDELKAIFPDHAGKDKMNYVQVHNFCQAKVLSKQ